MNRLSTQRRCEILKLLVEGNSLQAIARITGANINTVMWLLEDLGTAAKAYQDMVLTDLPCQRIQLDEVWSYIADGGKGLAPEERCRPRSRDCWLWIAFDPDSRLVVSWHVGKRTLEDARDFVYDLQTRIPCRVQVSTDGYKAYKTVVEEAFGSQADHGMVIKIYDNGKTDPDTLRVFDQPGIHKFTVSGNPDPGKISTSLIERQNLTLRQSSRRFARRTTGFSRKFENHCHAVALHFLWRNFCCQHSSLRVSPAMQIGIADHIWEPEEVIALVDEQNLVFKREHL